MYVRMYVYIQIYTYMSNLRVQSPVKPPSRRLSPLVNAFEHVLCLPVTPPSRRLSTCCLIKDTYIFEYIHAYVRTYIHTRHLSIRTRLSTPPLVNTYIHILQSPVTPPSRRLSIHIWICKHTIVHIHTHTNIRTLHLYVYVKLQAPRCRRRHLWPEPPPAIIYVHTNKHLHIHTRV